MLVKKTLCFLAVLCMFVDVGDAEEITAGLSDFENYGCYAYKDGNYEHKDKILQVGTTTTYWACRSYFRSIGNFPDPALQDSIEEARVRFYLQRKGDVGAESNLPNSWDAILNSEVLKRSTFDTP